MAQADKGVNRPRRDRRQGDALDKDGNVDQQKLKDNQDQLRVGQDHKTEDMRKKHRGTFP